VKKKIQNNLVRYQDTDKNIANIHLAMIYTSWKKSIIKIYVLYLQQYFRYGPSCCIQTCGEQQNRTRRQRFFSTNCL